MLKTGLTLGKFVPFHKGHEYLISTALSEMDHVIVIVYNASETTDIPTCERGRWIKEIFPQVEVLLAEDGPQATGYTPEIIEAQNNYLSKLLKKRRIHSFYSSEPYGSHVSLALGCHNRTVDLERSHVPVSGTELRNNPIRQSSFLSPCVLAALMPRCYLLGAPSTGKTTLAAYAAQRLNVQWCQEYGREYWFEHQQNHRLSIKDLENIAAGQARAEEQTALCHAPFLLSDTSVITTYSYALYYFGEASPTLEDMLLSSLWRHKHVFLCAADFPFEDTWDRSGPRSQERLQEINVHVLRKHKISYQLLSGTVQERFEQMEKRVKEWGF